jgi:hypothetical protein
LVALGLVVLLKVSLLLHFVALNDFRLKLFVISNKFHARKLINKGLIVLEELVDLCLIVSKFIGSEMFSKVQYRP